MLLILFSIVNLNLLKYSCR